jgi:hypothetical protein
MRLPRFATTSLAAVMVAAALAACGGSSSSNSSTSTSAFGPGGPTQLSSAQIQARVTLAKCLRAHGIDVPDSVATGSVSARAEARKLLTEYSQSQFQSALTACHSALVAAFPVLALSPAQLAQRRQQALRFVQCLRAHGVNLPDPQTTGGVGLGLARALSNIDTSSPAFQAANKACASLRPARPGGG